MKQNNVNTIPIDSESLSDLEVEDKEYWLNEHGQPDNEFLQALAEDGSLGALEKLRSIAADLDAEFSPNDSTEQLIGSIKVATRNNPNTTT